MQDPLGREIMWLGVGTITWTGGEDLVTTALSEARFVPLIGQHGWN
jgi:hypothetical protein